MSSTPIARLFQDGGPSIFPAARSRNLRAKPVSKIDFNSHEYTSGIAKALRDDYAGESMVKSICEDTGASMGAVKNWLGEVNGPGGEHLVKLMAASPAVLRFIDGLIGRDDQLTRAREQIKSIAQMIKGEA